MRVIADLHIHSKYSRATSQKMDIDEIAHFAKIKGLNLLGTGDITFPAWFRNLKQRLEPIEGTGLFKYRDIFWMLTVELSTIYEQDKKIRKIHHVVLIPSFEIAEQISEKLKKCGRLDVDGRPVFNNLTSPELVEILKETNKDVEIIPAHCLLPGTCIHCENSIKKIEEVKNGDKILTHKGRYRKVVKTFKRKYAGKFYKIIPWYFREGISVTPEHPLLAIKTFKNCSWTKGICKPSCSQKDHCKRKEYQKYTAEWIQARALEKGDVLVYPKPKEVKDVKKIKMSNFVNCRKLNNSLVIPKNTRNNRNPIKDFVDINKDFCLLCGYYLAEGYTIENEAIGFSFNKKETEYIHEVLALMKKIFGAKKFKLDTRRKTQLEIIFYSHILNEFFRKMFYKGGFRAKNKILPEYILLLPKEKLAEILHGWWRGDAGYTASRQLANQMKLICLKLNIIPSISIETVKKFDERGKHYINNRKIFARSDMLSFSNLSFFGNDYGLLKETCFKKFINKRKMKHGWLDENYIYLPIRKIEAKNFDGLVYNLEVEEDNSYVTEFASVHNCWTPWYGVFGSKSGFDSLEECYQDMTKHIFALETGLSSDPPMNWRLSALDKYALVSNSDAHSPWPWRIGREANVFELPKITYNNIVEAIREKDSNRFKQTIEVNPAYGKYHWTGHRGCGVSMPPKEAIKLGNICPVCKRRLTEGVEQRVEALADRPPDFHPEGMIGYKHLIPLHEIISAALEIKSLSTSKVWGAFNSLISRFGSEFSVLLNAQKRELSEVTNPRIAEAILRVREGTVKVIPGYDGVYGKILIFEKGERYVKKKDEVISKKQVGLESFM